MSLDQLLLDVLVCPVDKRFLYYVESEDLLYNPRLRKVYRISEDIPNMLPDEAEAADDETHERLVRLGEQGRRTSSPAQDDSLGMLDATLALPEQVEQALAAGLPDASYPQRAEIEHVVVLGMGASGIVGGIVLTAAQPFMAVPVVVHRGYDPPSFISSTTLVLAVSYSGDREPTLEAAQTAAQAGGRVISLSSGGELQRRVDDWAGIHVPLLPGLGEPRTAMGALAVPALLVLERCGLFPGAAGWVEQAAAQLRSRRDELVADPTRVQDLAHAIGDRQVAVYGGGWLGGAAAQRWQHQLNENAKRPATAGAMPEMSQHELAALTADGGRDLSVVFLRHDHEHPQVAARFAFAAERIAGHAGSFSSVEAAGDGTFAQLLDLMLVGDLVSLQVAFDAGIDPGPAAVLTELEAAVAS